MRKGTGDNEGHLTRLTRLTLRETTCSYWGTPGQGGCTGWHLWIHVQLRELVFGAATFTFSLPWQLSSRGVEKAFRMLDVVAVRCGRCSRHCTCGANIEVDYVGVKRCSINFNQPETTVRQRLLSAVAMAPPNLPVENMLCELCRSPSPKSLANRASIQFMCDLMLSLIHRDPRRRCQRCTPHTRPGVQNHVFSLDVCFLEQVGIISLKHI